MEKWNAHYELSWNEQKEAPERHLQVHFHIQIKNVSKTHIFNNLLYLLSINISY